MFGDNWRLEAQCLSLESIMECLEEEEITTIISIPYDNIKQQRPEFTDEALLATLHWQVTDQIFFPERGSSSIPGKKVCNSCPVQRSCLVSALADNEDIGTWGGTSGRTRRRIRKMHNLVRKHGEVIFQS